MSYDTENRLTNVAGVVSYEYDAEGKRVKMISLF